MFDPVLEQYVRWFVRQVHDGALDAVSERLRVNNVTDPADPLHRPAYHRLRRAGVPDAAIPAVLELVMHAVDQTVWKALWAVEHLRRTGHLRFSVRAEAPADWKPVGDEYEFLIRYCDVIEFGEVGDVEQLRRLIDRKREYVEPPCPLGSCDKHSSDAGV
jgi:hypothetical protein